MTGPDADGYDDEGWGSSTDEAEWPEIEAEAFHGLAGRIVDAVDPCTEADPVAVLAQLLVTFGNAFGHHAYSRVGDTS
jgi:hypothetical protein